MSLIVRLRDDRAIGTVDETNLHPRLTLPLRVPRLNVDDKLQANAHKFGRTPVGADLNQH